MARINEFSTNIVLIRKYKADFICDQYTILIPTHYPARGIMATVNSKQSQQSTRLLLVHMDHGNLSFPSSFSNPDLALPLFKRLLTHYNNQCTNLKYLETPSSQDSILPKVVGFCPK
jgi:hypothetical protein